MIALNLPAPEAMLGGAVWLPRIIAKARAIKTGILPRSYIARFCAPGSVDALFLEFFGITEKQIRRVADWSDAAVYRWFTRLPTTERERTRRWTNLAMNLGRRGFPMAEHLRTALRTRYRHLAHRRIRTIFELLNTDEEVAHVHHAAENGALRLVSEYLRLGGSPNALDRYDAGPLYYAIKADHPRVARLLLNAGGNVHHVSRLRGDMLGVAVWNLNFRMVNFVLGAGYPINRRIGGRTALDLLHELRTNYPGQFGPRLPRRRAAKLHEMLVSRGGRYHQYEDNR